MTFIIKSSKKPLSIGLHIPLSSLKEVNQALCALVSDFQIRIQRRKRKVITMVMTLRSLCLLKVNELREGLKIPEDFPQVLVRDLMIAELFNGNFQAVVKGRFCKWTWRLSVTYDGEAFTLSANILTTSYVGNPPSIRLCKIRVGQNTTVRAENPLFDLKSILKMMRVATKDGGQDIPPEDLVMRMHLTVNIDNWKVGRLEFVGPAYKFIYRINRDLDGSRSLSHHGVVNISGDTMLHEMSISSLRLVETSEKIKIEAETDELEEKQGKGTEKKEKVEFKDPEKFQTWEILDDYSLKTFWMLVENNE